MNYRVKGVIVFFCILFAVLSIHIATLTGGNSGRWVSNQYNVRIHSQRGSTIAGSITDRNGEVLASSKSPGVRKYNSDKTLRKAVSHVVGDYNWMTMGAETIYSQYLIGFEPSLSERISQMISGKQRTGSNIALTIDAQLCEYAYTKMGKNNGAVVLMNYKTGEVLAMVSKPEFDPTTVYDIIENNASSVEGMLVNRVNMGQYTPGSVFKIVTLLSAIQNILGVEERVFHCEGRLVFEKETGKFLNISYEQIPDEEKGLYSYVTDHQGAVHGEITLKQAFEKSCNCTFALLALEVGAARLHKTAAELTIGEEYLFSDIFAYKSSFVEGERDIDVAWSGAGQYKNIMVPLNMCMISSAIANEGVMMEPKLLLRVENSLGNKSHILRSSAYKNAASGINAAIIKEYMLGVVKNGTGSEAAVKGYQIGGKTGTAEVSGDKAKGTHAWFTGFVLDDEHPLAICVILENAGSGGGKAAPLASALFKKAINLGY